MTLPPLSLDSRLGLLCVLFFLGEIDDEAVRTFFCIQNSDCSSDSAVSAYIKFVRMRKRAESCHLTDL